jgi:hypothetical protein
MLRWAAAHAFKTRSLGLVRVQAGGLEMGMRASILLILC